MATTPVRRSRIDDSSDNRSAAFYDTKLLTSVDRDQVEHAYEAASGDAAFGYEFVRKATFREINFGPPAPQPQMTVGGQEVNGKGFPLCPDCGRVEKPGGEIDHTRSCRAYRSDHAEEQRKRPFLYREVTSEALRILLPEGTLGASTKRLRSFRAALLMGLEEVFSGTVHHLKATVQEAPDAEEIAQRRYLALYDRVPGGTGYLAELSRSEGKLMDVFEAARRVLKACSCQHDPGKDGCYQCLYAYRDSYHLPQISRREALAQLRSVLEQRGNLVETDTIDNISLNPLVDSVLERRFLEKVGEQDAASLDEKPVRGKTGYVLRFGERRYEIEPQVTLGPDDGIARALSVDFMIRPQQAEALGRPIAVFLDGLQYHRERIGRDLAQRRALQASCGYRVWSLTWEDLKEGDPQQPTRNLLTFDAPPFGALLGRAGESRSGTAREIAGEDSFAWLRRYLQAPDPAFWQRLALVQALLYARSEWDDGLSALPPGLERHFRETVESSDVLCGTGSGDAPLVRVWVGAPKAQVNRLSEAPKDVAASIVAAVCFDDDAASRQGVLQETWNGVLRLHNLLQFLPDAHVVTSDEEAFAPYDDLLISGSAGRDDLRNWFPSSGGTDGQAAEEGDEWSRVMEYALEETAEVLQALRRASAPPPQMPPCELTAENGRIDGVIELAWPSRNLGIALPADEEHISAFEARGWTVWPLAQARQDPDVLAHALIEDDAVPATN